VPYLAPAVAWARLGGLDLLLYAGTTV